MPRYGTHGRVLIADLTSRTTRIEEIDESVYRQFLGGYGLGAYLMWKHYPPGADALAPEACFAIVSGLLTGARTPFSGRIQIVGKSPLTGTWADSNSGGSVASQLRRAGYDALLVTGRASEPSVLVIRDGDVTFEPAGELWGQEIPPVFDALRERYGSQSEVGVCAIGPAGEQQSLIASVMNDRYHAFGRQGFGAIYGAKNLKAIVVAGSGEVPIAEPDALPRALLGGDPGVQVRPLLAHAPAGLAHQAEAVPRLPLPRDGALGPQGGGAAEGDAPAVGRPRHDGRGGAQHRERRRAR